MAERLVIRTSLLGIPIRREVVTGRKVVWTDLEYLKSSDGEYKTVVFGQTGRVVIEHYTDSTIALTGLCHVREISADQVKLESRIPFVKRKLVKSKK